MLTLALATYRERWPLFTGAILAVMLGVAIVQSSLLIVAAAGRYGEAIAVLGLTLGVSAFLAVFVVSETFAFTIAQRRRDLALLRLIGGSPVQLRRLLLAEAWVLGALGTVLGVPAGRVAQLTQTALLADLGLLPITFSAPWRGWVLWASIGLGLGVATAGVLAASRRAARVRPLEALRETGAAARGMTVGRWLAGLLLSVVAIVLTTVATAVEHPDAAIPLSISATVALTLGLAALGPALVAPLALLVSIAASRSVVGRLTRANLREARRRSASIAAPVVVLVALATGLAGTFASLSAGARNRLVDDLRADLVAAGPVSASTPGVTLASTEYTLTISATTATHYGGDAGTTTDEMPALAIDPDAYPHAHRTPLLAGSYDDLRGRTVVAAGGDLGEIVQLRVAGQDLVTRVVAVLPAPLDGGPQYLLPHDLVPSAALGAARSVVRLEPGADPAAVAATLPPPVLPLGDWLAHHDSAQDTLDAGVLQTVLGMAALYAAIGAVSAIAIATGERRRELAVARVTGLSRGQVVVSAVLEALIVSATGIMLGWLAALATLIGISRVAGALVIPWQIVGLTVPATFLLVATASACAALAATRRPPIAAVGARE